jgi:hypothetical protein
MLKKSFLALVASLSIGLSSYSPPANASILVFSVSSCLFFTNYWGLMLGFAGIGMMTEHTSVFRFLIGLDENQAGQNINQMASQLSTRYHLNEIDSENVAVLIYNETVKAAQTQQSQAELIVRISAEQVKEAVSLEAQQTADFEQLIADLTK